MKNATWKRTIVCTLLLLLGSALLFVSCGKQGGKAGQPSIAIYAYNSEPILDWDPSVEFSNGIVVLNNVYETLVRYDAPNNKVVPVLATEYSKSADSLSWIFKIRQGVKFHDGTDLDAAAVKFSIDRTIKIGKGAAYIWASVKDISVVDPYTVKFDLKYPAPLDLIASAGYAAFIVSPKAVTSHPDGWLSQGNEAGTGPYALQSFKMGQEVVLSKFEGYWRGWEGKHYDKVVFQKIPETASRRQMIEKGDASFSLELPSEDIDALKKNSAVTVFEGPSYQNLMFFFNTAKKPLDNKLVRQALSYAFPYADVVKYAMGDYATQARGAIPANHWGHGDDIPQYSYDIAKAKDLLAKAGYPNGGFSLHLTYLSGDEAEKKAAELYKSELTKLNIDLEIRTMPWDSQWELSKSEDPNKRQDIMAMYWWPDYASPASWLINLYHSEDTINYNMAYWKNKSFDELVDRANEESGVDRSAADKLYVDAQKILVDEAPAIFLYDKKSIYVMGKSFHGYQHNPIYPNVVFFYDTYKE